MLIESKAKSAAPKAKAPQVAPAAAKAAPKAGAAAAAPGGGYAQQKSAVQPKGLLGQLEAGAGKVAQGVKNEAMNLGGEAIGLAEMVGLKYPVKPYEAQVSGQLYRGARVEDDAHMQALAKQGIKGIVNLCAENDMDTARATQCGLQPLHIPIIDNTAPKIGQVQQFLDFVGSKAPVYVHCEAGQGRTGTMVACYRIAKQGWTAEAAVAEAQSFGMKMPCQMDFIRSFAAQQGGAAAATAKAAPAKAAASAKAPGPDAGKKPVA